MKQIGCFEDYSGLDVDKQAGGSWVVGVTGGVRMLDDCSGSGAVLACWDRTTCLLGMPTPSAPLSCLQCKATSESESQAPEQLFL